MIDTRQSALAQQDWSSLPGIAPPHQLGHKIMTMKNSQRMAAGEFKAKCLSVLDRVAETKAGVIITKHGRPVAQLVPITPETKPASLLGSVKYHGDIVAPLDEPWDVES
ncbi:MAG TPA: type II toxin-antitoxin system prevent-host-death family antitoxin [Candidatus Binatia bacterium]